MTGNFGNFSASATNATHLYASILHELLSSGERTQPRGMETMEHRGARVILYDPLRCIVDVPSRKLNYHFMVGEWWWIAMGDNRVESISHYCNEIAKYSDDGLIFYGAYGPRWRSQIDDVICNLLNDRDSRQAVVTIFRPELYDQNMSAVVKTTRDVPCTISMQYLIRNDKLETIVTMRSWDAYLGFPYDIFNFARLGALVAGQIGIEQGPLIVQAGSLHLYSRNYDKAADVIDATVSSELAVEPLPELPASGYMRILEQSARQHGLVTTDRDPWKAYVKVLADRKVQRNDLTEPFKMLLAQRRIDI
jgi:thymidylate synthase